MVSGFFHTLSLSVDRLSVKWPIVLTKKGSPFGKALPLFQSSILLICSGHGVVPYIRPAIVC